MKLSRAAEEHLRELLQGTEIPRDSLPYTPEFARMREEFHDRTLKRLSDEEFWLALLTVGKRGGITGKRAVQHGPLVGKHQEPSTKHQSWFSHLGSWCLVLGSWCLVLGS